MAKKLSVAASRHMGVRLLRWAMLALAGVAGGMMLGEMAAGPQLASGSGGSASYSQLSANPGALPRTSPEDSAEPCPGCADSYGVGMRMRAAREARASDEFPDPASFEADLPVSTPSSDADDDYRYGGRFPDPEPPAAATNEEPPVPAPAGNEAPGGETAEAEPVR